MTVIKDLIGFLTLNIGRGKLNFCVPYRLRFDRITTMLVPIIKIDNLELNFLTKEHILIKVLFLLETVHLLKEDNACRSKLMSRPCYQHFSTD